ncbi:hypothetical protein HZS_4244 [Henneguya salminicola]|nr:hypothetical protein HZS_4244 [Henneguya salminicola]
MTTHIYNANFIHQLKTLSLMDDNHAYIYACANIHEMEFNTFYFKNFLNYKDAIYFTLKRLNIFVRSKENIICRSEKIQENIIKILVLAVDNLEINKKLFKIDISVKNYKKLISKIWLFFLRINLKANIKTLLLNLLDDKIFPYIEQPRLLTDFLIESFEAGHFNGLFGLVTLMIKYNVECPLFYHKLYHHLVVQNEKLIQSDVKMKFWHVVEKVLQSTHLPTYIVASFIKILSRKAIFADLPDVIIILNIVGKLLSLHEPTRFLLNTPNKSGNEDLFDYSQSDFSKNNIMASFLWEFNTLLNHYNIYVRETIKSFLEDSKNAWNWRLTYLKVPNSYESVDYHSIATKTLLNQHPIKCDMQIKTMPSSLFNSDSAFKLLI